MASEAATSADGTAPVSRLETGAIPRYANTASRGDFFGVWARKEKKETGAAGAVSAIRRRRAP